MSSNGFAAFLSLYRRGAVKGRIKRTSGGWFDCSKRASCLENGEVSAYRAGACSVSAWRTRCSTVNSSALRLARDGEYSTLSFTGASMRALVTGGAGFIGSTLVDALVARGDEVTILDNLSTGRADYLNPDARFIQADLIHDDLDTAFVDIELVFHTAALARVPRSIEDPVGTHEANVTATLRVLKAAADAGSRRVIYSSSSSVYGDQPTLPLTEPMAPNPLNPYACQKLMGELYARNFARVFGLHTTSLRYFNVYGPRQAESGAYRLVIGIFLEQRRCGERLTIHGDGLQTRDFTHVSDVVRANLLASSAGELPPGEVINVGAGREVSIRDVAALVGGPVEHLPPRGHDERFKRADIAKARALLGWEPRVSF